MAVNILLVVLDAVRRDAVEPYAPAGATPAIGELARRGTALPHAYATSSWTLPSHASMFTGLQPRELGLTQAPGGTPQSARPALEGVRARLLPRVLQDAGYETHGWSTNLWVSPYAGFDIGFDSFSYVPSDRVERMNALLGSGRRAQLQWALDGLRSASDDGARAVGDGLRQAIAGWSGKPAFWFVNLCECHSPYLPPRPFNDLGAADRARAALEARRYLSFEAICLFVAGHHEIPPEAFARMRHLYARAAAYMDDWLAGVLGALEERGILDDTVVIVTSDHGENFGEAGLITHGFSVDQRLIHVPLVLAGPGVEAIDEVFSFTSMPGLIGSLAGIPADPWSGPAAEAAGSEAEAAGSEAEATPGIALAAYDPLGPAEHPQVEEAARRWGLGEEGIERMTASYTCATDGRFKLVVRNGRELLFDLADDPDELRPRDPAHANGTLTALRAGVARAQAEPQRQTPDGTATTGATVTTSTGSAAPGPDEIAAIEQQMKLLGYM